MLLAHLAAVIAVLSTGVIYGTDVFCALVQRPALARVDDATLTAVMGNVHRFGDQRLPAPGILGIVGAAAASVLAALDGRPIASATAGAALALLVIWLLVYLRVSAPINRALTAAGVRPARAVNVLGRALFPAPRRCRPVRAYQPLRIAQGYGWTIYRFHPQRMCAALAELRGCGAAHRSDVKAPFWWAASRRVARQGP